MKPLSEAAKRVYRWRIGADFTGTEAELWDWFNNWSGRNADGSLTYKTMLYERLEDIANELKQQLTEAEGPLNEMRRIFNSECQRTHKESYTLLEEQFHKLLAIFHCKEAEIRI